MAHTGNFVAKSADYSYLVKTDAAYAAARTAATASSGGTTLIIVMQTVTGGIYYVQRGTLVFDTSTIPVGSVVTDCKLYLYTNGVYSSACDIVIQSGLPDYPHDPVVLGDFDYSRYSSDGGSKSTGLFTPYGHWDYITLNSTGRGWVQRGGTTKLVLRTSTDIAGTAPGASEGAYFYNDSGHEPYLSITWTEVTEATAAITASSSVAAVANQVFAATAVITPRMAVFISTAIHLLEAAVNIVGGVSLLVDGAVWSGTLFEYLDSLAPGSVLVIDCDQQLLTLNSVNDMKNMDGDWISLGPGVNEVTFTDSSGARTLGVTVVYKDRWV